MPEVLRRAATAACLALAAMPTVGASETLTLATGKDYPPFTGRDLPDDGLATAVVRRALAQQGYDVEVAFMAWRRAYERTVATDADATFPYVEKPDRREETYYSEPIFRVRAEVISWAERPVTYDGSLASLAGHRVCVPEGFAPQTQIEKLLAQDRLERVNTRNIDRCPQLIALGRADFFAVNNFVWPSTLRDAGMARSKFHVADTALKKNTLHLIVSRQHPQAQRLIADFNAGLATLRDDGQVAALRQQHLRRDS